MRMMRGEEGRGRERRERGVEVGVGLWLGGDGEEGGRGLTS